MESSNVNAAISPTLTQATWRSTIVSLTLSKILKRQV